MSKILSSNYGKESTRLFCKAFFSKLRTGVKV